MTTWSQTNTFDWIPTVPNANYKVGVRVRSRWNKGAAEITAVQPFVIQEDRSLLLGAAPLGPRPFGPD